MTTLSKQIGVLLGLGPETDICGCGQCASTLLILRLGEKQKKKVQSGTQEASWLVSKPAILFSRG